MATTRTEMEIRQDIQEALKRDARVDPTGIDVHVVNGVVYLRGTVPSYQTKHAAAENAGRVAGVTDVVDELRLLPAFPRTDEQVKADVSGALARDKRVDESRIDVDVLGGAVRLTGTVAAYADKLYSGGDAWEVSGVVDVANDIVVEPTAIRPDPELTEALLGALTRDQQLDPNGIAVEAVNGVVYLRGTVATREQKLRAEEDAWWTAGVRSVVNELDVSQ